jgi:competence protein ComFB
MTDKRFILVNCMEDIVWSLMDEALKKFPDVCTCEMCLNDIAALALNELPPQYVAREKGKIYAKLPLLESQYRADVFAVLTKAIQKVKKSPRHYK